MAFTLLVCSEFSNHKLNVEVPFNEKPQLPALHASIEAVFDYEASRRLSDSGVGSPSSRRGTTHGPIPTGSASSHQPPQYQPFTLGRLQVYNDELRQWVDLVSASQLHPYDQLYAYQRAGDSSGAIVGSGGGRELPPPVSSPYFTGATDNRTGQQSAKTTAVVDAAELSETVRTYRTTSASPTPNRHTSTAKTNSNDIQIISAPAEAFNMSSEEKMRLIFQGADVEGNGYLTLADFRELFSRTNIQFNRATIDEIFRFQGSNQPSYLNFNDFTTFCREYPVTFSALFTRITDRKKAMKMEMQLDETTERMNGLRRRREQLQRELEEVSTELGQAESYSRKVSSDLNEQIKHREVVEEEEQLVLDKEVRVAYQREVLRREEADFIATARRFDMHVDNYGAGNQQQQQSYQRSPYRR